MHLALEDRQAIPVRPDAADEERVALIEQVVRGDGCRDRATGLCHILRRLSGGDVLEHDAQCREIAPQRLEHSLDEDRLTIEDVDARIDHLAVDQQGQAFTLHGFERGMHCGHRTDAGIRVGGGTGRIELDRMDRPRSARTHDLIRRSPVGEIERHQRLEAGTGRVDRHRLAQRGQDAFAIGQCLRHGGHRRLEVGHHDGSRELAGGSTHHCLKRGAVAQMQMPVVRADQCQGVHGCRSERRNRILP